MYFQQSDEFENKTTVNIVDKAAAERQTCAD